MPRRRQIFLLAASCAGLWVLLAVAVESSQALRFRLADPWPADQPALWTPDSRHVEQLDAAVGRLRACLRSRGLDGERLAITPDPALGPQGLYWSLWVIAMLPERDMRIVGADGRASPARYLLSGAPRPELTSVCLAEPLRLYALAESAP